MKFTELKNEIPTLEVAKKLCKRFKRPLNNQVIILGAVAPMVTAGGIELSESAQKQNQVELNKGGMLVVNSPFKQELDLESTNPSAVYEGERILYMPESQVSFNTVVTSTELLDGLTLEEGKEPTSEMYKKYVVLCMGVHQLSCVIED